MKYRATKTYGHDRGLSVAFRQWRADSHCSYLHGYALSIELIFEADVLNECGWVIDFGAFKEVKEWIDLRFDHVTLVAFDDPNRDLFVRLAAEDAINLCMVTATGCEAFAGMIANWVCGWLEDSKHAPRVRLHSVEVREHGANSATVLMP